MRSVQKREYGGSHPAHVRAEQDLTLTACEMVCGAHYTEGVNGKGADRRTAHAPSPGYGWCHRLARRLPAGLQTTGAHELLASSVTEERFQPHQELL